MANLEGKYVYNASLNPLFDLIIVYQNFLDFGGEIFTGFISWLISLHSSTKFSSDYTSIQVNFCEEYQYWNILTQDQLQHNLS